MNPNGRRSVVMQVRVSWWLKWYIQSIVLVANLTGLEPNWERVGYWARRALYWREVKPEGRSS